MSSPPSVRQRKGGNNANANQNRSNTPQPNGKTDLDLDALKENAKTAVKSEWDYKLALLVITGLAFLTRFWGIGHPDQVVFDEVHFGKVRQLIVEGYGAGQHCAVPEKRKTLGNIGKHLGIMLTWTI